MKPRPAAQMGLGQPMERPYRLAPQGDPETARTLPRETYRIAEVAKMLGVSRSTVYEFIQEGRLPAHRMTERMTVVRRRDLDAFLDSLGEV